MAQSLFIVGILVGLYFTTFVNYLLFHSLTEFISIAVACAFFMITWNSKSFIRNPYLLFIGIAYLFIAFLDLLHTLSYKGMPIFTDYDYYANQLWIGARYMESITLATAFWFLNREKTFRPELVFGLYTVITTLIVMSVFIWKIFPVCFIEGQGLTPFKKISEYIICLILVIAMGLLQRNRHRFTPFVYRCLLVSLASTIISELAFTFYISNYGFSNLVGHYFKLISFYFIYKSIVETGIRRPYEIIFRELAMANHQLSDEIKVRKEMEKEREQIISQLQTDLADVKTLSGLLPICSHCKNIRDDKGYWNKLEVYLDHHSDARLSHGICPDCMKKHYPEYLTPENTPSPKKHPTDSKQPKEWH
jgi:hypothetical protein